LRRRILLAVLVLTTAGLLAWLFRQPLMTAWRWISDVEAVTAYIRAYGLWGPVVLSVLFFLQVFLAFIPGQALMIASGYLYGFLGGFLITWTSLVLSGQIAFWLVRRYGRPFAEKWIKPTMLDRWDKSAAGRGVGFYVITLVMPFFPNDAMCYVAGLSRLSSRQFLQANMLGRGIACLLTVIVGAFSAQIPVLLWVFAAGFVVLGAAGWWLMKKWA